MRDSRANRDRRDVAFCRSVIAEAQRRNLEAKSESCIFAGCHAPAVHHAYSTVNCGDVHACERCAPSWLKAKTYGKFYAATRSVQKEAV